MEYKYAIVITGGIAVGKSTVKNLLYLHGYRCIDADVIAHKILDSSYIDIANMFGKKYIIENKVDRKELGKLIFSNKEKKQILEEYIHPKIQQEIQQLASKEEQRKFTYFIDIPLFFETKKYDIKKSLVIYAPKHIQLERLMLRDNINKNEALSKINAQMDMEQKLKLGTYVIDNSKDFKHLQIECDIFLEKIKSKI
ncbi:Dephospho-CoA kinase [hydrothermal vent metagenome]|uniref:Dephospho-CoA kinase n=1 Tax=hydrothermal vent metagenome TaxID=652676 RepID=A0A3B1DR89_9ZZZZ